MRSKVSESEVSRVTRPRLKARANYDRLSRWYDWLSAPFERAVRERGLELLDAQPGERILELGFGTGWGLVALVDSVGASGRVYGIDQSSGMLQVSKKRVEQQSRSQEIELLLGDAVALPLRSGHFDAVFMCFMLELFDTPEIPAVLSECRRMLRAGGRLSVVSLSKSQPPKLPERLYEALHTAFPVTFDCRPIHVGASLSESGFKVISELTGSLWGLPVAVVLASPD